MEAALDWLCLNIPGDELPRKFSSGISSSALEGDDRSMKIISTARDDWAVSELPQDDRKENLSGGAIRVKVDDSDVSFELGLSSQADWVRQYMEREEEEIEQEESEVDPISRATSLAEEYHQARMGARIAKDKGDKKNQKHYGEIIGRLKQEISSLGLSDDILKAGPEDYSPLVSFEPRAVDESEPKVCSVRDEKDDVDILDRQIVGIINEESVDPENLELDGLFCDDFSTNMPLSLETSEHQKREKALDNNYQHNLRTIDDIWKKGDPGRIPKAVLHKLCQKLGWDAPKYSKIVEKGNRFLYSISVLRTATGRGKSRMAGGLISLQLPEEVEGFASVEDAQNNVAAFALCQFFPDLPIRHMLVEPYSSSANKWEKIKLASKLQDDENNRRSDFVDSLLKTGACKPMVPVESAIQDEPLEDYDRNKTSSFEFMSSSNIVNIEHENMFLKKELSDKMKTAKYMEMLEVRASLPIDKVKNHLMQSLEDNDVIVVCGETGCGKTTQVPQYILDDMIKRGLGGYCHILCTQPRRIAAISVAERVSRERCEPSPGLKGSLVGFHVRLDSSRNEKTKLLFCTTGILLRMLFGNKDLTGVTHVIVDEVHERSLLGDFLLVVLKHLLKKQHDLGRRKLKVILMSATVDSTLFSRYFGNCPVISAEGRNHPVSTYFLEDVYEALCYKLTSDSPACGKLIGSTETKHMGISVGNHKGKRNIVFSNWDDGSLISGEYINPFYVPASYESYSKQTRENLRYLLENVTDYELLEDLICYIDENYPPGAILVFLPGVAEISLVVDKLASSFRFSGRAEWILPLHSSLSAIDQRKVFITPPQSERKVIVSTNIAETSITIDDVVYVVDSGKHKENRYNPQKKMTNMAEDWISKANAKQRWGRAGRVKPGLCFCLYTRHRFEKLMRPFQIPEMLRMPLTELCLQIKSLALGDIRPFLMEAIEPPSEESIQSAIDLLYKVGAFEGDEELSPLGYHLAKLPVDVLIGKMILYGTIFRCLSPILSIASALSYKFPFVYPKDENEAVERAKSTLLSGSTADKQSDHLLVAIAYERWARILKEKGERAANQFCRSAFLNSSVMYMIRDMRMQFGSVLADIGLINPQSFLWGNGKRNDKLDSWLGDLSQPFNIYARYQSIVKAVICAGLYPNVAATLDGVHGVVPGRSKEINNSLSRNNLIWYDGRREVHIHPSSVNYKDKDFSHPFIVFLEKVETGKVFLRDSSIISPYSILLFGGAIAIQHQTGLVTIDDWLKLSAPAQTAVLFKELRQRFQVVLKEMIRNPEVVTSSNDEIVRSIANLLLEEDKP